MDTNMDEIRNIGKMLLYTDLHFDETFGFIIHHPFFQNSVYAVNTNDGLRVLNLTDREELSIARNEVKNLIDRTMTVADFLMLVTKPYLPAFFKFASGYMSEKDYSMFLAEMWITVEFPNYDKNISALQFVKLFKKANKKFLMTEEDLKYYDDLPETITVYRGVGHGANVHALSWTTDIEKAKWFSQRWSEDGAVYSAEIDKKDILAYFSTRGESEVVVDFKKLKNIQKM